ncbi:signal peptidase I [Staphylococcus saccharolyticus]|uniref:signal peptidase I n=1 Tax=Staphylococcus saccharolyticus TaxID=33028 RepID=UPI0032DEB483
MKKEILEWITAIAVALIIVGLVQKFLFASYTVKGESMHPTFEDKNRVIVNRISKTLNHIESGDVVIFHATKSEDYIKRLIGKPGDTVQYKKDQLYLNGKKVSEPYLDYNKKHKAGKYLTENFTSKKLKGSNDNMKIPKNKYLVLGDNRENSVDSRYEEVGLIDKDQIVGKVTFRYWPFNQWKGGFNSGTFPN